jgi:hypothetical protein
MLGDGTHDQDPPNSTVRPVVVWGHVVFCPRADVDEYLAQHDAQPETIEKLRWLLAKAVGELGDRRLGELRSQEIAAWRMTIAPGHRFEASRVSCRSTRCPVQRVAGSAVALVRARKGKRGL